MSNVQKTWRALTVDTHFPDAPFITFENFDADREVQEYLDAGVDSAHVYMKCHWGHYYYDTRVGTKHPQLTFDMVAELVPRMKAADIETIAYTCFWFQTRTAREHPDWCVRDPEGHPVIWRRLHGDTGNWRSRRWGMCCPNHPAYRAQCLDHIEEIFAGYAFDGVFLDILGEGFNWRYACHCEHCRKRYHALGIDPMTDRLAVVNAWCDWWTEVLTACKARMLKHNPRGIVSLNGGPFRVAWRTLRHVDWPYSEGGENGCNPIVLRGCGLPFPQAGIGAGPAAYDDWSRERVKLQASTVLAQGNRTFFFYMTGRDPDGSFASHKLAFLRHINEETVRKQAWVEGTVPIKAVAVYHSEATLLDAASRDDEGLAAKRTTTLIDHLRRFNVPCEFLPAWRCTDDVLNPFKLVVVSHQACLSNQEIATFARYVKEGGALLVAGECGTRDEHAKPRAAFPLFDLLGLAYDGLCTKFAANGVTGYVPWVAHPFFRHLRPVEYNLWQDWPMTTAVAAERIAPVVEPVAVETDDNYVGWFPLPPGRPTPFAGLTRHRVGKGIALFSVSPLTWFEPNSDAKYNVEPRWPAAVLRGIIEELRLDGGVGIEGPGSVEATFRRRANTMVVHLLNRTAGNVEGGVPAHGIRIRIDHGTGRFNNARVVYPVERALKVEEESDCIRITAPPVEMHTIVVLEAEPGSGIKY